MKEKIAFLLLFALAGASFALPDLQIQSFYFSSSTWYPAVPPGEQFNVFTTVYNGGDNISESSVLRTYAMTTDFSQQLPGCTITLGTLAVNQSATKNCTFTMPSKPIFIITIADYYYTVQESNEDNNNETIYAYPAYCDNDGDHFNASNATCAGYPYQSGSYGIDCNDNNAAIHPYATEVCGNAIDEDCNGADLACPSQCGDGYCNATANETCKNCVADCGPCPACAPRYYCKDKKTRAYLNARCETVFFKCGVGEVCSQGVCTALNPQEVNAVTESIGTGSMAQMQGPPITSEFDLKALTAGVLVFLVAIGLYAFIRMESEV